MKFMRSHMIIWGRFFRWGLSPHTPCSFIFHIYFLGQNLSNFFLRRFHLQTMSLQEKAMLKAVWQRLLVTAHCSIWIYFPFPILLYILILLLTYSNIVVQSYSYIYLNTPTQIALQTFIHKVDPSLSLPFVLLYSFLFFTVLL